MKHTWKLCTQISYRSAFLTQKFARILNYEKAPSFNKMEPQQKPRSRVLDLMQYALNNNLLSSGGSCVIPTQGLPQT